MKRNKLIKIFAIMMIAILSLGTLASCGKKEADSKKLKIVVTTFPEYDWVREILGDRIKDVDLKLLQKNGTDLHSFQPSAQDIKLSLIHIYFCWCLDAYPYGNPIMLK